MPRLLDADGVLKGKIVGFVLKGDFGLASGQQPGGGYARVWYKELISADEVVFDGQAFLLLPAVAEAARGLKGAPPSPLEPPVEEKPTREEPKPLPPGIMVEARRVRLEGAIAPEIWNRVGTRLLPKLRGAGELKVTVGFIVEVEGARCDHLVAEIQQILIDLALAGKVTVET